MKDIQRELNFEVVHFGVNCADGEEAAKEAGKFASIFGLPIKDGQNSIYAGPLVELMKGAGKGTCGHIGIAADNVSKARAYLESQGLEFDLSTARYDGEGNINFIYLKNEIAGFAVHIMQRN